MKKAITIIGLCCMMSMAGACGDKVDSGAYDAGLKALEQKNYVEALAQFQVAAKEDGRGVEAYRCEGITYLEMEDYEHAVILLDKSLEELDYKDEAFEKDVNYYLAAAYQGGGQTDKAVEIYGRLIEQYEDAEAYFLRGKLYLEQQEEQKAASDFQKSLEKDSGYENYLNVYLVYAGKNRGADGAAYLEQAVEKTPENVTEQYQQGRIFYYLEEYDRAKEVLNKAVNEGHQDAVFLLGKIYLETNDAANARALYQNYLQKNKNSAKAYNGLALCDIAEENYQSALLNIQSGLECNDEEEQENLLFNEIVVYEKQLDFNTAKQKMSEFLSKYPDHEDAIRENNFLQSR